MKNHYNVKRPLLASLFMAFAIGASAQISTLPWNENFEDSSPTRAQWTQIYEVNNMSWTYATAPSTGGYIGAQPASAGAYEGTKMANYPGTSHNFDTTKLVSPPLNLSGYTNVNLNFFYRNPYWNPDQNWLTIFYRTAAASPWVQVIEFHTDVPSWAPSGAIAIPNTAYQIAIQCKTDYGYSTVVDALVLSGSVLSSPEFAKNTISYFPNPTANVLNFSCRDRVSGISVYNVLGQKVMTAKVNATDGQVDLSSLAPGTYVVEGITESGTEKFKVVKR